MLTSEGEFISTLEKVDVCMYLWVYEGMNEQKTLDVFLQLKALTGICPSEQHQVMLL